MRLRGPEGGIKPPKVSLPILESAPPSTETPAAAVNAGQATPPPRTATAVPLAQSAPEPAPKPKISLSRELPSRQAAAGADVACPQHADQKATASCLNCAKPICPQCIHEFGNFCSSACVNVVKARGPKVRASTKPNEVAEMEEKAERAMDKVMAGIKLIGIPLGMVFLAVFGYVIYKTIVKPEAKILASMQFSSDADLFHARIIEPDRFLAQANDELFLATLSSQEKDWTVDLKPLREKGASTDADAALQEKLRFTALVGNYLFVRNSTQLVNFGVKEGNLRWKLFKPETPFEAVCAHEGGALCVHRSAGTLRLSHYAMADGAEQWAVAAGGSITEPFAVNNHAVFLRRDGDTGAPTVFPRNMSEPKKTLEMISLLGEGGSVAVGREPLDEVHVPDGNYTLLFLSLADGKVASQKKLTLAGGGDIRLLGKLVTVTTGSNLMLFEDKAEPRWIAALPSPAEQVRAGGDAVVAKAGQNVVSFNASDGKQRWNYTQEPTESLAVGTDGGAYISVKVNRDVAMKGEWAKYPRIIVTEHGFAMPGEPILTTLALDPATGNVRWGVKNLGRQIRFANDKVYTFDVVGRLQAIGAQNSIPGAHRVTCFAPKTGKQLWYYRREESDLYHFEIIGNGAFLATSQAVPMFSKRPVLEYDVHIIERK